VCHGSDGTIFLCLGAVYALDYVIDLSKFSRGFSGFPPILLGIKERKRKKKKSKRKKWRRLVSIASPDHPLDWKVLNIAKY